MVFAVAKDGSASGSGIVYSAMLKFTSAFLGKYLFRLDSIRVPAFKWRRIPAHNIAKTCDELMTYTHATDLCNVCTY